MTRHGQSPNYVGLNPTSKRDDFCVLNDDDVVHLLRATVEREGSQIAFAKRYGFNRTELNMVLNGKRPVSGAITKTLGLRKIYVAE